MAGLNLRKPSVAKSAGKFRKFNELMLTQPGFRKNKPIKGVLTPTGKRPKKR